MRTQYCRDNIDKVAENCGLADRTVQEVKQAADFCDKYREFSQVSTSAIITLIRVKEVPIKEKAISHAQNFLNEKTPTGGVKNTDLTAKKVREIIKAADMLVRKEYLRDHPEIKESAGPKEVDPATVATTYPGGGILAMCETREGGGPCIELDDDQVTNPHCNLTKKMPAFMGMEQCPKVKAAMESAAKVAHVPAESVQPLAKEKNELRPATCIGCMKWATCSAVPNTADCKHQPGLVDDNTPDTRTDPVTYNPPRPIERTDKDDRANGVVRQQVSAVHIPDLKVIPMEIRRAELRIIAQMVMYGVEDTEKSAAERMIQEGRVICEDLCERALNNQVEDEDSFEEVSA